ncbi:MAG: GTP 3',8-cyclase MoaA [Planctomycetota bacterium]|nr:MAG: GTP 3',8-cyclase MoaA [Planctomycetota bacterium]
MEEMVEAALKAPVDRYGRRITDLRISITSRCNLKCPYCHKEGVRGEEEEQDTAFWRKVLMAAAELNIRRALKITGGEPLLRADLEQIIAAAREAGFRDISLVTNGTLLDEKRAKSLAAAGLKRINIGCDAPSSSILPKTYERVGGAVDAALAAGLSPVKLNMVVLAGINDDKIEEMLALSRRSGVVLQLIELIDAGDDEFFRRHYVPLDALEGEMSARAVRSASRLLQGRRVYWLSDGAVVEFVRSTHANFCRNCRKIRVTPAGNIKPCLLADASVPFRGKESFLKAIAMRRPWRGDG